MAKPTLKGKRPTVQKLRCRVGDTVVTLGRRPGRLLTVLALHTFGERVDGIVTNETNGDSSPAWVCVSLGSSLETVGMDGEPNGRYSMYGVFYDSILCPLKGDATHVTQSEVCDAD